MVKVLLFLTCLQVKVVGPDNKPVANEAVHLSYVDTQRETLTTDVKGMASFSLNTTAWTDVVSLKVGSCCFYFVCLFSRRIILIIVQGEQHNLKLLLH